MNSRGFAVARRRAVVVMVLGLVGSGFSGCGINRNPYADVTQLEVAWTAPLDQGSRFTGHTATDDLWIAFEAQSSQLFALRLVDGSVAWTLPSGERCGFSEINAEGLLAVRSGTQPNCDQVQLIDTTAGQEVWSAQAEGGDSYLADAGRIGLSETVVSAPEECGVGRWEIRSGKKLVSIEGSRRHQDLPGHCRAALTSTDLAVVAEPKALVGYDVDTGKKRWSREGKEPDIGSLHSTDPLLAEVQIDGVAGLRTIEAASGELGPVIGRPKGRYMSPGPVSLVGDRVVGSYQRGFQHGPDGTYEAAVRAWDPSSGKELASWPGRDHEDYLGTDSDGVYLGREAPGGRPGWSTSSWVTRADWSGEPARTVGWIDDDLTSPVVVGDLLIDTGYGELAEDAHGQRAVAYRLPEKTTADQIPPPKDAETLKWAKGDVRPDPTIDPCAEVSADTLRGLGLASLVGREVPLDCERTEGSTALRTHVEVVSPDSQGDAIQNARAAAATARGWMESPVAIDGLGDEAWAAVSTQVASGPDETYQMGDPSVSGTEIRVAVRQQNVVAYVAIKDWPDPRMYKLPAAAAAREASAVAVLKDVVKAAGAELRVPARAGDGPVTRLPDMCDAVAADVRKVLPGAKATDLTAPGDERLGGCLWATRRGGFVDSHVQVVAYAVGVSPLTGVTGSEAAEEAFVDSQGKLATPLRDKKWDEAVIAEDFTGGYRDASQVRVRSDNVVLVVGINLRDRDKTVASTIARRIADHAMRVIRS